jgi:hypothetical protein
MMNKINLLGYEFKIEAVKETLSSTTMATLNTKERIIYVEEGWDELETFEAIMHEAIEFINDKNELKMTHNQITSVAFNITAIMVLNGMFTASVYVPSPKGRIYGDGGL